MERKKLKRSFYERSALEVAQDVLGKILIHHAEEGTTSGRIVEVEAYMGPDDAAAHSYKGLRSNRTEVMFGPAGHAYVYLIYGMYHCFNIVSNKVGIPQGVLVRALEPIEGIELMKKRRKTDKINNLCSGPGKLCAAMDIGREHNKMDLCGDELYIVDGSLKDGEEIVSTPRINIDYAGEAANYPWRFVISGNKHLSR
jgi:DNA-3-methyladenine glycosylase